MTDMLLSIGEFAFHPNSATYSALKVARKWKWAAIERYGTTSQLQFVGHENAILSLSGSLVIEEGEESRVDAMQRLTSEAEKRRPLPLLAGSEALGQWVIESCEVSVDEFFSSGLPRKLTFSLELRFYGS